MEAARLVDRYGAGVLALPVEVVAALRAVLIAESANRPQSGGTASPSREAALADLARRSPR